MVTILDFFSKIFSFFFKKEKAFIEPPVEAEIIHPIRFQYLKKEDEKSSRTKEESLELFKAYQKAELDKKQSVAKSTRDVIIQAKILEENDLEIIQFLIQNPWLDEELQYKLLEESDIKIKCSLARRPAISLDIQKILSEDPNPEVRRMLVRWQRPINPAIASKMIKDEDLEVRKTIATVIGEKIKVENILCFKDDGEAIQEKLIEDFSNEVRHCLASNKNLKKSNQIKLVQKCIEEKEWGNLTVLAENEVLHPDCEAEIRKLLHPIKLSYSKSYILRKLNDNKSLQDKKEKLKH